MRVQRPAEQAAEAEPTTLTALEALVGMAVPKRELVIPMTEFAEAHCIGGAEPELLDCPLAFHNAARSKS